MNESVKNVQTEILYDQWSKLKRITFEYLNRAGNWETHKREVYERGNGVAIMLYNVQEKKVILTRQFRIPTYINGNSTGMMIEACAGLLDDDLPEAAIIRETEEETGYKINHVEKVFEAYMSPGSVSELLYFYIAKYSSDLKAHEGGGIAHEQENIEVMEIGFSKAIRMIRDGEIKDAKTIMLLQYLQVHQLL